MWYFQRIDPFDTLIQGRFIAFVGAGGKTSLSEYLAAEALRRGKRVALTTTTKIWAREPYTTVESVGWKGSDERLIHVGKTVEGGKLTGLSDDEVLAMGDHFDLVLIEADGSKSMPLKYPAEFEPVIPGFSDRVVVVAGLDAIGGRIRDKVFRWELFTAETGISGDVGVSGEVFTRLFKKDAMMKDVDPGRCTVFLNKYDAYPQRHEVRRIASELSPLCWNRQVIIGSMMFAFFYGFGRYPASGLP
jgi:probable selenium-dependent hydroxylase accessory protein YqeC